MLSFKPQRASEIIAERSMHRRAKGRSKFHNGLYGWMMPVWAPANIRNSNTHTIAAAMRGPSVFRIQRQPFLKPRLGLGLDRVDRALGLAHPAIDAFVRVDDEHVLPLEKQSTGHTSTQSMVLQRMQFEVGQLTVLSAGRSGELVELQRVFPPRYAQSWQIPKCRCAPLAATVVSTWWRTSCIAVCSSASSEST